MICKELFSLLLISTSDLLSQKIKYNAICKIHNPVAKKALNFRLLYLTKNTNTNNTIRKCCTPTFQPNK